MSPNSPSSPTVPFISLGSPSLPCRARSRVISVPDTVEMTVGAVGMTLVAAGPAVNFRPAPALARKPGSRRSPRGERRRDTVAFLLPT
ncbi:hypothetical protein GCM10010503_61580 [Streptomyces lucensis JCM 4490]|uniref:Uncharacterized protein n=1 Tax=Streptomyces lucensis JCM 4490 TaxID=1306176 RepID=A0A918JGZ4_9ACTN|nr:hypothetical protein GCM10010503_61580 [Streptomyces lucensis JCM 4490]